MEVKLDFGTKFIQFSIHLKKKKKEVRKTPTSLKKTPLKHKTKESQRRKNKRKNPKIIVSI